jgi:hypothetical protein
MRLLARAERIDTGRFEVACPDGQVTGSGMGDDLVQNERREIVAEPAGGRP